MNWVVWTRTNPFYCRYYPSVCLEQRRRITRNLSFAEKQSGTSRTRSKNFKGCTDWFPTECNKTGVLTLQNSTNWLDECNLSQERQCKINASHHLIQVDINNKPWSNNVFTDYNTINGTHDAANPPIIIGCFQSRYQQVTIILNTTANNIYQWTQQKLWDALTTKRFACC